ncbi:uncharacterized protein [Branchiostoma lanceolatum]|uniref:uncharacterized protein n=1 Tax=Branchiostoma lanceolatum TaxID=7740 RepID=UPI003453BBD8
MLSVSQAKVFPSESSGLTDGIGGIFGSREDEKKKQDEEKARAVLSKWMGGKRDPAKMSQTNEQREGGDEGGSSLWGMLGSKGANDSAMTSQMSEKRVSIMNVKHPGQKVQDEPSFWDFLGFGGSDEVAPPQWKTRPRGAPEASRKGGKPVRRGDNPVLDFFNDMFKDL